MLTERDGTDGYVPLGCSTISHHKVEVNSGVALSVFWLWREEEERNETGKYFRYRVFKLRQKQSAHARVIRTTPARSRISLRKGSASRDGQAG